MTTFVSLFSGVGGFDLGLEAAGWECVAQVEWDRDCQAVLAQHWPHVPRWSDICDVHACRCHRSGVSGDGQRAPRAESVPRSEASSWPGSSACACGGIPPADVIAFGSPCQDLSVAGQRAGFVDGGRSNLFYEAVRIIKEMRHATRDAFPRLVIWENVGGALSSSGGRDFAAVLDQLADCGAMDIAWRVLDARWFGVPQRRRRVFVVADFAGHGAGEIHAESESVRWNPRTGRQAWQDVAGGVAAGVGERRTFDLSIRGRDGGANVEITEELAAALRAGDGGSSRSRAVLTTHTHTAALTSRGVGTCGADDNQAQAGHLVVCGDPQLGRQQGRVPHAHTHTPSLRVGGAGAAVMQPRVYQDSEYGVGEYADAGALRAGRRPDHQMVMQPQAVSQNQRGEVVTTDYAHQLTTGGGKPGQGYPATLIGAQVRRLTPVECERLMGWPDDHTRWRADGTEVPDTTRYRMCGNGVASPVAEWLATQLDRALEAHP